MGKNLEVIDRHSSYLIHDTHVLGVDPDEIKNGRVVSISNFRPQKAHQIRAFLTCYFSKYPDLKFGFRTYHHGKSVEYAGKSHVAPKGFVMVVIDVHGTLPSDFCEQYNKFLNPENAIAQKAYERELKRLNGARSPR